MASHILGTHNHAANFGCTIFLKIPLHFCPYTDPSHNLVWTSPSLVRDWMCLLTYLVHIHLSCFIFCSFPLTKCNLCICSSPSQLACSISVYLAALRRSPHSHCVLMGGSSSPRQSLPTNFSNTVVPGVMGTRNTHRVLILVCLGCSANLGGMITGCCSLRLVLLLQR